MKLLKKSRVQVSSSEFYKIPVLWKTPSCMFLFNKDKIFNLLMHNVPKWCDTLLKILQ